jgi:hypothetical protein
VADIETVRRLALVLPEVEEGTWFRTPAWKVRKKSFAWMKRDGENGYPAVLVRLAAIEDDELAEVLENSWRRKAPKRLIAERDA